MARWSQIACLSGMGTPFLFLHHNTVATLWHVWPQEVALKSAFSSVLLLPGQLRVCVCVWGGGDNTFYLGTRCFLTDLSVSEKHGGFADSGLRRLEGWGGGGGVEWSLKQDIPQVGPLWWLRWGVGGRQTDV